MRESDYDDFGAGARLLAPKTRVFLATDEPAAKAEFKAHFDSKTLVSLENKYWSRSDLAGLEEGIMDMMLLSKCPILIGTYFSTYSLSAWHIGGAYFYQMGAPTM